MDAASRDIGRVGSRKGMKEVRDILETAGRLTEKGSRMVLATVVHLEGSSYRRPGARMLVSEVGEITGAISGGCLEGDALEKAMLAMSQQQARIVTYDTMDDEDPFGVGLGCNGILQVLMEPILHDDPLNPIRLLQLATRGRRPSVLATLFSLERKKGPQPGTCLLLDGDGGWTGHHPDGARGEVLKADMQECMQSAQSRSSRLDTESGAMEAFIEHLPPAVSLVIVGAGNDAIPLVEMAHLIGWETTVVDGRSTHARPDRFQAGCRVLVSKPEEVLEKIHSDERTAFVLMTHNYAYDKALLKVLLQRETGYLGMLGPGKKCERMLEEFRMEGLQFMPKALDRLHAPVGLDIGAEGPEEIAVSIVAGICAAISDRPGTPLRNLKGAIHPKVPSRMMNGKPS
jgi:xanthine dehydrogenase accessory factor